MNDKVYYKVTDYYINLLNKFGEWKRIYEEYERAAQMIAQE